MKKKLLACILAVTCVFSLTACSGDLETLLPALTPSTEESTPSEEPSSEAIATEESVATEEALATEESTSTEEDVATEEATATEDAATTEEATTPSVAAPAELSDDLYSFQLSIDGTVYQFPMWFSDFEAMGWSYNGDATTTLTSNQYTVAERWNKGGFSVYTQLANLSMNSVEFSGSMVAGITLEEYYLDGCDWQIILPKGIQYGVSTRDDIIAAYGDPSDEYEGDSYYKMTYEYDWYQEVVVYVSKETGVVNEIEIENMIELEGADNSIDPTVPDVVNNYVAPTELGNDLYSYNIELEGKLYNLPCPVSVFVENGFTINEENSEMEIGADGSGWLELRYNNQSYRSIIQNYADYATIAQNCFVTSMESSDYEPKFNLVIPGNIKRGDSEDAVKAAIADFNHEVEVSGDWTYYNVAHPDAYVLDGYTITVKEGVVISIEVEHDVNPAKN